MLGGANSLPEEGAIAEVVVILGGGAGAEEGQGLDFWIK